MKKYISLIVCAVLIILSVTVFAPTTPDVIAGRGNGTNTKINTVEEFVDVLEYFNNYSLDKNTNQQSELSVNGYEAQEESSVSKHTSATVNNKSRSFLDYSYDVNGISRSSTVTLERDLTIYMTEDAAFYESKGKMLFSSESSVTNDENTETERERYIWNFEMEIYVTHEQAYFYFKEWEVIGTDKSMGGLDFNDNMLNKWFYGSDAAEGMMDINSENYEMLYNIGKYFEDNKPSNFIASGKKYTLKDDYLVDFLEIALSQSFPEKAKGSVGINLSVSERPQMNIIMSYNDSQDGTTVSMYDENNIRFENIDNTFVGAFSSDAIDFEDFIKED